MKLYGFDADQTMGSACCTWATFLESFVEKWEAKFGNPPRRDIVLQARHDWAKYSMTGYESFVTRTQGPNYDRHGVGQTEREEMMSHESKPFWMVWNPLRQPPHHRHETEASAWTEAERLAAKHPEEHFIVLQSLGEA